jgi:hypothetical protein
MGVSNYACLMYGIRFSFNELKPLKTNPIVVAEPDDDFQECLNEFWCGEFEGVFLYVPSPYYDCRWEYYEYYVSAPFLKNREHLSKAAFMAVLNDEVFIENLKKFCVKFGLKYQEPEIHSVPDVV